MLSKKYRFHSRGGVRYVYKHGKTLRHPQMSLVFAPNSRGYTRIAVVVSKKVEKTAVKRNRIRRRIYEALRHNLDHIPPKTDYIFIVFNKSVATLPFPKLEELLGDLVTESKVCYNKQNG